MTLQIQESKCASCFHFEGSHNEGSHNEGSHNEGSHNEDHFCKGDIDCMCLKFVPTFLNEMAQEIEFYKHNAKTIRDRCRILLQENPNLRNVTDKTFHKVFLGYWYDFWPSKTTIYDYEKFKRMPTEGAVNREKRRIKKNENLGTYDPEVLRHQQMKFEAYMEMALEK